MRSFRKWLLVGVGALALQGLQACTSDELNPQPLPPEGEPANTGSSGSGGDGRTTASPTPGDTAADAGAGNAKDGGDAGDAGDAHAVDAGAD